MSWVKSAWCLSLLWSKYQNIAVFLVPEDFQHKIIRSCTIRDELSISFFGKRFNTEGFLKQNEP